MLERVAWYWDKRGVRGDARGERTGDGHRAAGPTGVGGQGVTGDALYCQRELSLRVLEQGGDYFWALKDNQPGMREAVSLLFAEPPWGESFAGATREGHRGDRWEGAGCGHRRP